MSATDVFSSLLTGLSSPVDNVFSITPADGSDLAFATRGLYVGVSGDVKVTMLGGDTVVIKNLAPGMFHPLRVTRVWSADTDAEDILGGY